MEGFSEEVKIVTVGNQCDNDGCIKWQVALSEFDRFPSFNPQGTNFQDVDTVVIKLHLKSKTEAQSYITYFYPRI